MNAAAELSYAFEEFQATGHLLEQVLTIQEKLLGPEHPDLGQTLNNLGVLRHTQGRHAEAEAYYQWALEICETYRDPLNQDAVNLMQNYAAFLQEVGRNPEADASRPGLRWPESGVTRSPHCPRLLLPLFKEMQPQVPTAPEPVIPADRR